MASKHQFSDESHLLGHSYRPVVSAQQGRRRGEGGVETEGKERAGGGRGEREGGERGGKGMDHW